MLKFDPEKIKLNFPIFDKEFNFGKLIYLDSAATSQRPKSVINSVVNFYENYNSNVHRSINTLGESATTLYEGAREKVANFINASPEEIIFTKGTTESINFVAESWARKHVKKDDMIVTTQVEHHANLVPWQKIAQEKGAVLKFIELDKENFFLKNPTDELINSKTKIVSFTHSSNVLGDVWKDGQIEKTIKRAHEVGAKVLIDVAQTSGRRKIDVKKLDVDFLALSGHKMLAPTGIGVLYIKKELHDQTPPYQVGGSMVYSVSYQKSTWQQPPAKFEAGTPPIAQAIGLGAAIDYLNEKIDFNELEKHEAKLASAMIDGLLAVEGIQIFGNIESLRRRGHLVSFWFDQIHAHDLSSCFATLGTAVRSGHHCAQPLAELFGIEATVRASFYMYNTLEDVNIFLEQLNRAIEFFKK